MQDQDERARIDSLRRLVGGREPSGAMPIVVPNARVPHVPGTMLPALGSFSTQFTNRGSMVVPVSAGLPGTPAYMKAFMVLQDYAVENAEGPPAFPDPAEFAKFVVSRYPKVDLLMALSYLNHCLLDPSRAAKEEADFVARLPAASRSLYEKHKSAPGMGRVFLSRQAILLAMKQVLKSSPDNAGVLDMPLVHAAVLLTHAISDTLNSEVEGGGELWKGMPEVAAMEVVQNYAFHVSEDFYQRIGSALLLWNEYGGRPTNHPLPGTAAQMFFDATGLSIEDFISLGLGLWAPLSAWEPGSPLMTDLRQGIGVEPEKIDRFLELTACDLDWFSRELTDKGPWDFVQFEMTPVVQLPQGQLILDETFLQQRLTSGLFWFVHDHQRQMGDRARQTWTAAFGGFIEQMALDRIERMAVPIVGLGRRAIFTEEEIAASYPGKHCDAVIEAGDLVGAFEIVSGNLTLHTRQWGDADWFRRDTLKLVLEKAEQLHPVVVGLRDNPSALLGRAEAPVVVAVCVEGGGYPLNPVTAIYVADELEKAGILGVDGSFGPAVIDIGELEMLAGLSEAKGLSSVRVIREWLDSQGRGFSLRNYLMAQFPNEQLLFRPQDIRAAVEPLMEGLIDRLRVTRPSS